MRRSIDMYKDPTCESGNRNVLLMPMDRPNALFHESRASPQSCDIKVASIKVMRILKTNFIFADFLIFEINLELL